MSASPRLLEQKGHRREVNIWGSAPMNMGLTTPLLEGRRPAGARASTTGVSPHDLCPNWIHNLGHALARDLEMALDEENEIRTKSECIGSG